MVLRYLLVLFNTIVMSGEIPNRVEDLHINFSDKLETTISKENESSMEEQDKEKKKVQGLSCDICKVKVTSPKIFQRHLDGRKHKLRAERQGKEFKCELCDIIANSEIQLEIHLRSARHKAKLQKKEYPRWSSFGIFSSKIQLLIFVTFICILLNLFLLSKFIFAT